MSIYSYVIPKRILRQDGFEIINVDADAKLLEDKNEKDEKKAIKGNYLFSSVISGEVPAGSYFVFASESLPEYLSSRDLVSIITKLPPIVAAEQIKNVLAKINNYVPFLGIIIKNTTDDSGGEISSEIERVPLTTHNSISSLNYTEARTESMLSPAGLINFSRAGKIFRSWIGPKSTNKRTVNSRDNISEKSSQSSFPVSNKDRKIKLLNLPSSSSFLRPHKVLFKKGSKHFFSGLKQTAFFLPRLFSPSFWRGFTGSISSWLKNLSKKNLILFAGLIIIVIAFSANMINSNIKRNNQRDIESFNLAVTEIQEKESLIDPYLLYDNKDSANRVLSDIKNLVSNLPREKEYQIAKYNDISERISEWEDKILGIIRVNEVTQIATLPELDLHGLTIAGNAKIANSNDSIYSLNLDNNENEDIELSASSLQNGRYNDIDTIYFRDGDQIISLDVKDKIISANSLADFEEDEIYTGFDLFNSNLYLVSQAQNQLFVYPTPNFNSRKTWLKESADLSQVNDIYIDGSIYLLEKDGKINKFHLGRAQEYESKALEPSTTHAQKILGDDNNLYILADNKRLIVVNKEDGKQIAQYLFSNLNISDFAINSEDNSVLLLADGNIYDFKIVIKE